jgi:formate transporter
MDYVTPKEMVIDAIELASKKADLSVQNLLIRGALAGAFLGCATSLAFMAVSQGLPPLIAAVIFPVGFVMLVLLGQELATGNFALLPLGVMAGRVRMGAMLRNWAWVYLGNLLGSVAYALLFYLSMTSFGTSNGGTFAELFRQAAQKKTLGYMAIGMSGWMTALVKGLLCNWMVTLGALLALASRSTTGKVVAMWLPITTFFALGYEHSIVNMFVIPTGMMLGAPISVTSWLLWNQIPVTVGNMISGFAFTALPFVLTYHPKTSALTTSALIEPQEVGAAS